MQRHFRGIGNHYRIEILLLVERQKGITVKAITKTLEANFKTISHHTNYLVKAGLMHKKYWANTVKHSLSPYGLLFVKFIRNFQRIGSEHKRI